MENKELSLANTTYLMNVIVYVIQTRKKENEKAWFIQLQLLKFSLN